VAAAIRSITDAGEMSDKIADVLTGESGTEIWSLVMLAEQLDQVVALAAASAEPANLAKYTFALARAFNLFYHRHRIISEEDETRRAVLICAAEITRRRLTSALATLGIAVPERM
jgi:arginyl-tRNA synthetase